MRLFVVMLALTVAASTQAMAFGSLTKKAEVNEGCPAYYYRGVGGNCGFRVYCSDSYWTSCDYS
jgi:hypothetical protein